VKNKNYLVFSSGLEFPRFFPGPMEGVMTPLFCKAFHQLELTNAWLTPYYRVTSNVPRDGKLKKFIQPFMENDLPVIVQLMGVDAPLLTKVAERMVFWGAKGINLNFACPSRQVIKSCTGGALLKNIPQMVKILESIKEALPEISLSAKIRCGFEDWKESENIIPALTEDALLDFIGVHFRTVKENYLTIPGGVERLKRIVTLAGEVPIIGSGDVFSMEDAQKLLKLGCVGAMVARGVLRDPFLIHNLQETGEHSLSTEAGRQYFFESLQKIARADNKLYSRAKFLEYACMIWGRNSKKFSSLKVLNEKDLLNKKIK
jgi:tRNA-dihydrouridine synthase C